MISPGELASLIPAGFILGAATAAFQIEGGATEDGRTSSSWDAFSRQPGTVHNGDTADIAADHYHRSSEDVSLLRSLGVNSYRFSISWPRVLPDGGRDLNPAGLAFYDRLLDQLLAAGIEPAATLYHWDTPLALEAAGGWLNRDTAQRLGEYAAVLGTALGDRVQRWITVNEPATLTLNGYGLGIHAPGKALLFDSLSAAHHQLLGHGYAVQALRAAGVRGDIGITNVHSPVFAAGASPADAGYAQLFDLLHNRIFADPVLLGRYPQFPTPFAEVAGTLDAVCDADLELIHQPLDFYGLNYYAPTAIAAGPGGAQSPDGPAPAMAELPFHIAEFPQYPRTGFGWPIAPEHLGTALAQLSARYQDALPPVYITENGASHPDPVHDGTIDDVGRIEYLSSHLEAALRATAPGGTAEHVRLRGYYHWSLLDNFEWAAGYSQRFGLVHVDFHTLARTPKRSFYWYRDLIAAARAAHGTAAAAEPRQ